MRNILSVDGGGSKLRMLLFDENFNILGRGLAGGVNTNSTTAENSLSNIKDCLDQVFGGKPPPPSIDKLYVVFVGPVTVFLDILKKRTGVKELAVVPESEAGLMAGALWEDGFLAVSGTGSDIFLVDKANRLKALDRSSRRTTIGGWGPIIGDQGSGVWIGQTAIRAVVSGIEGWTEKTLIHDLIRRDWKLNKDWDMVPMVYQEPAPFRKVASLTRQVEEAAAMGDAAALRIVKEAGELMALQSLALFARFEIPPDMRRLVCCGGAWKTHPLMFETFKERILVKYPDFDIRKPLFEHLLAGPAFEMSLRGLAKPQALRILREKFPDFIITW
ncbi:MAG: hypothetical protein LBG07_04320 [Treponema sp.]|jgi:N-acetylglucosamine kinase-like BadF-type ATPase|nr:hypothetical protein [Treponema sp.]